jgi:hypothetical protein
VRREAGDPVGEGTRWAIWVAKAYLLGMEEISAVQFPEDPAPDRIRPLPDWLARTL